MSARSQIMSAHRWLTCYMYMHMYSTYTFLPYIRTVLYIYGAWLRFCVGVATRMVVVKLSVACVVGRFSAPRPEAVAAWRPIEIDEVDGSDGPLLTYVITAILRAT